MARIIAYHRNAQHCMAPVILLVYFGDGNIEFIFYPINNAFQYPPFILQRLGAV